MKPRKRKPIAAGDRVWMLRMNTLVHGAVPCVTEGRVKEIGKEITSARHPKSYRKIYNCLEIHSRRQNVLCDKDTIRPFTKQGKAELLRLLVNQLNTWAHQHHATGNACLDLAGAYLVEIANLEGGNRGKTHRTNARAAQRVGRVAGGKA